MDFKFWLVFVTALIPLITGFIWYHPKVFGNTWMRAAGLRQEDLSKGKMGIIFGLTYIFGVLLSFALISIVIHQFSVFGVLAVPDAEKPGTEVYNTLTSFMAKYGRNFRTFKHGMLHGFMASITVALPLIGINALFERKRAAYIFVHLGYWMITLMLMGGVLCQFL